MSVSKDSSLPRENRLLAALPEQDYQSLVPHLELVSLSRHQVLYHVGKRSRTFIFQIREWFL